MKRKFKTRKLYVISAIVCIVLFAVCIYLAKNPQILQNLSNKANGSFDTSSDFIKFMDVGQGDSALIYSNGNSAVIDTGLSSSATDICNDLSQCEITEIDVVLISHLHSDHLGGFEKIAKTYTVKNLIMPEILSSSIIAAQDAKTLITSYGSSFYNAVQGINFTIGEFEITLLGFYDDRSNENNRSVYTIAEIDGIKFLFTGDAETKAEKYLLNEHLDIDCDVLKVSHHGSNTSSSEEFLNAVTPEYAVISVGEDNMYSHPHSETLDSLQKQNAAIYRTDLSGDVTFYINNGEITVKTEK